MKFYLECSPDWDMKPVHRMSENMLEDYGTLSERELMEEILQELEENTEINASELEIKFDKGKLVLLGVLPNEEELENLIGVLENHLDAEDYELDIELAEGSSKLLKPSKFTEEAEEPEEKKGLEDTLEEIDDDEMDFVDDENFDEEKW